MEIHDLIRPLIDESIFSYVIEPPKFHHPSEGEPVAPFTRGFSVHASIISKKEGIWAATVSDNSIIFHISDKSGELWFHELSFHNLDESKLVSSIKILLEKTKNREMRRR